MVQIIKDHQDPKTFQNIQIRDIFEYFIEETCLLKDFLFEIINDKDFLA